MEHLADELDCGRLIWILLLKMHDQSKGSIFKGSICGADDDSVPVEWTIRGCFLSVSENTYQVITLSATGEAETPAGGSVCIRCNNI